MGGSPFEFRPRPSATGVPSADLRKCGQNAHFFPASTWVVGNPIPRDLRDRAPMKLDAFEVDAVLGEGGSAVVYDARLGDRRVALKVLREDLALSEREKQRFVDEAKRLVMVAHPGLERL